MHPAAVILIIVPCVALLYYNNSIQQMLWRMICQPFIMPEGPSIVILKEQVQQFKGQKILEIGGNTKVDFSNLAGQKIIDFKSFGKNFFICFKRASIKIHFMLFGSYRINEQKQTPPRLTLRFKKGELNFYACSVKLIEEDLDKMYDWTADVMNENWSGAKARKKLKQ